MRVGFVVIRRARDIEVQISMPGNNDRSALVTYSRIENSFALLIGYLYYQQDLLAELVSHCSHDSLSEWKVNAAALVLAAYHHCGVAFLKRL